MKVKYTKIYKPFVDNSKFKFTLGKTYEIVEYNIGSQKMFIIKDDNDSPIKYTSNSRMSKHFDVVNG